VSQEPVAIAEYSTHWPAQFEAEAGVINSAFGSTKIKLEHIGSTAVPGLAAKPIIDILLGADSLAEIENHITHLEAVGYRYVPAFEKQLPDRRYFVKANGGAPQFHLHAVACGSTFWRDHLRFRDALRHQPALREQYLELKRQLASSFRLDRDAYANAKAPFIEGVLNDLERRA
jgi:GrpB-like predicted nucleotidyltransferase (UPF0157 family)